VSGVAKTPQASSARKFQGKACNYINEPNLTPDS
jgi:hypothetical protein